MDHAVDPSKPMPHDTGKDIQRPWNRHPDRIKLSPEALARLSAWLEEVGSELPGVKLNRGNLVSFLILSHAPSLSETEVRELRTRFHDEVKFGQWALEQVKAALARGEDVSILEIIDRNSRGEATLTRSKKRTPKSQKTIEKADKNDKKLNSDSEKDSLISVELSTGE